MSATDLTRALAFALLAGCGPLQAAPPPPAVTESDIKQVRRSQPLVTEDDMRRARERHPPPTDAALRRAAPISTPNIDRLPRPAGSSPIDLEALARGFDAQQGSPAFPPDAAPSLLIFISFSMPDGTLTRLADQAARVGATLVLRGLVEGSLMRTAARVQQLVGTRKLSVQIDPQAFDRYAVTVTPTFVLVRAGLSSASCKAGSCQPISDHARVAGDVSLDYALAHIRRTAPPYAKDAARFLQRLPS